MRSSRHRWADLAFALGTVGALLVGLARAFRLRWVCDDAFITFRYADNWIGGLGPVYNAGERVEGYTHFLWLCLIAAGRRLGIEPVALSQALGITAYAATILLFAWIARAVDREERPFVPMTALALALHFDANVWATGGLETALFTLLVGLGFAALVLDPPGRSRRLPAAGMAFALATLTRPDGLVPAAAALVFVVAEAASARRSVGRAVLAFMGLPLLCVLPYLIWKVAYYGAILPNTYYAKSGGSSWFAQGFLYIGLYLRVYLSSLVCLAAVAPLVLALRRGTWRDDSIDRAILLSIAIAAAYLLLFVAKVGGDFMFARFVLPVTPLLYLAGELGIRRLLSGRPNAESSAVRAFPAPRAIVATALLILVPLLVLAEKGRRDGLYPDGGDGASGKFGPSGVTDEHAYYTRPDNGGRNMIETYRFVGTRLARYFEGTDVRVVLGGQACLGYYGRFAYCLERWGLTDAYVAHLPVTGRTRPGHEKAAPLTYLITKGIHFEFMKRPYRTEPFRSVYFKIDDGRVRGELYRWDRELMRRLRDRFPGEVTFVDFETWLDDWLRAMPGRPVEEVRRDYETFREFYFLRNDDPEREGRILAYIGEDGAS
jgi:arabinofuranosyltransferase